MHTPASVAVAIALAAAMGMAPPHVHAQEPARPVTWTVVGGYHSYDFRDVSRHRRPVDASPITWRGEGPAARFRFERESRPRTHRIDLTFGYASHFSYRSPIDAIDASSGDRSATLSAAYEYRRYLFRDAGVRGLDVGAGAAGAGTHLSLRHEFTPGLLLRERRNGLKGVGTLAARLSRWQRLTLETAWSNGLSIERRRTEYTEALASQTSWGGWWYSDWSALARIRFSRTTSAVVEHLRVQDGFTTSHMANASARRFIFVGVAYAR